MRNKYKYIAITKTWRDKINGNTYFSSNVEATNEDRNYLIPFQYGYGCLLYTSPSPRDRTRSRMPSSA